MRVHKTGEAAKAIVDLHYLPSVAYLTLFEHFDEIYLEQHDNFIKQTYRNRCYILTSNKIDRLSVPVKKRGQKMLYRDVEIDYTEKWENRHWRAIKSAYANAPFFEFYADGLVENIFKKYRFLYELNLSLLSYCLKVMGITTRVRQTDSFLKAYDEHFSDFRSVFQPRKENGIIHAASYHQLFTDRFIEHLSIIDLLFNEGNEARKILQKQRFLI
mgnify:CR=1 FL=1